MPQHFYLTFDEARDEVAFAEHIRCAAPALLHLPPPPWVTPSDGWVDSLLLSSSNWTIAVIARARGGPAPKVGGRKVRRRG
jgi:hypothetical protein